MRKSSSVNAALSNSEKQRFRRKLLSWYDKNRRDLPWREDRDPYRVWLSEIMLQQTRVAAVIEHYQRFLQKFPTVKKLAAARKASVLAVWSGLGYYRRARMLHAAAKQIMHEHRGQFPPTAEELRQLSGIGRYTAAAIASIAFSQPVAVVDGNVERVLQRLRGKRLAGELLWQEAENLLSRKRPGDFNQAMMELGATVCLPRQPLCPACPVFNSCATRGEMKSTAKKPAQKKRGIAYALDHRDGRVFLVRRPQDASLMPGMWELPEIAHPNGAKPSRTLRHSITVTDYTVRVIKSPAPKNHPGKWVSNSKLTELPVTGLARKILRAEGLMN